MKVFVFKLLSRCIEEGIQRGINRAHKHTDNPSESSLIIEIQNAIELELFEWFDFSDSDED
jgi:hypothetical protein